MKKYFCVVSHTHWDREWYLPLEKFRIKLVNLMNNLIRILNENPEYIFHMDSQTKVIDDYLEIFPEKRNELIRFIRSGRLVIGPWYIQNDFFLTSGEATIRNLMTGIGDAESYGGTARTGYAPDQFGIISQLPQILMGFGIDNFIFGRGLQEENCKSEFLWEAPDGSRVLAVNLSHWYNNAQSFSRDPVKSLALLEKIEQETDRTALTPYRLCMNGVDHLEPQEDLFEILEHLNSVMDGDGTVLQVSMEEYILKIKEYIMENNTSLDKRVGELRRGSDEHILNGTLSSRIYIKRQNTRAQNLLEKVFEPFFTVLHLMGIKAEYAGNYNRYLWRKLLENHPHDSICGCSADEVHRQMEDRFERFNDALELLTESGLDLLASHIDRRDLSEGSYLAVIVNTLEHEREEVVEVTLQFPEDENTGSFEIINESGDEIPFVVLKKERIFRNLISPVNLPGNLLVDSFSCLIQARVPSYGYRTYVVNPLPCPSGSGKKEQDSMLSSESGVLEAENDLLKLFIHPEGRIDLENKRTGIKLDDVLSFEESDDCGDVYTFRTRGSKEYLDEAPEIEIVTANILRTEISLRFSWELPAFFDRTTESRSAETEVNQLTVNVILEKDSPVLGIKYKLNNRSGDHRVRGACQDRVQNRIFHGFIAF